MQAGGGRAAGGREGPGEKGPFGGSGAVRAQEETVRAQEETVRAQEETVRAQEETVRAQEEIVRAQEEPAWGLQSAPRAGSTGTGAACFIRSGSRSGCGWSTTRGSSRRWRTTGRFTGSPRGAPSTGGGNGFQWVSS